ncbi:MAG: DUF4350 domain-containing protein [Candidatus Korarchaeota archaeon]
MGKLKTFLLFVATFFVTLSFLMPLFIQNVNPPKYSSFNTGDFGCSEFREMIEEKYKVETIISSLSILSRVENNSILVIIAPTMPYSATEMLNVLDFINRGGTILVADDNGAANTFLYWLYYNLGFYSNAPYFAGGVNFLGGLSIGFLVDIGLTPNRPRTPDINTFFGHPITSGISRITLNLANVIAYQEPFASPYDFQNGKVIYDALEIRSASEMIIPIAASSRYSFLDISNDLYYNSTPQQEPAGFNFVVAAIVSAEQLRMVLVSDPTIFTNEMIDISDNKLFAERIIDWLASENTTTVYFDESHSGHSLSDPIQFAFLESLGYIFSISTVPLFYAISPVIALYSLRRWVKGKKIVIERSESLEYKVGQTLYTYKKIWYVSSKAYGIALHYILKKYRNLLSKYGIEWRDPISAGMAIASRLKMDPQKITKKLLEIEDILSRKISTIDERRLIEIYSFLNGIMESLKAQHTTNV